MSEENRELGNGERRDFKIILVILFLFSCACWIWVPVGAFTKQIDPNLFTNYTFILLGLACLVPATVGIWLFRQFVRVFLRHDRGNTEGKPFDEKDPSTWDNVDPPYRPHGNL